MLFFVLIGIGLLDLYLLINYNGTSLIDIGEIDNNIVQYNQYNQYLHQVEFANDFDPDFHNRI